MVQPGDCVTVTTLPATVTVPVRAAPSVAATRKLTTPGPLPLLPPATEIHGVSVVAVHGHPGGADTGTSIGPPVDPTLTAVLPTVTLHPTA